MVQNINIQVMRRWRMLLHNHPISNIQNSLKLNSHIFLYIIQLGNLTTCSWKNRKQIYLENLEGVGY